MNYTSLPTPTAAGDPLSTDKCCCGHQRSEHALGPCTECAQMIYGLKCAHFTRSYRIIDTDNFGGDYPNEKVIASGITYRPYADAMCDALIARFGGNHASRFYRVVEDDYELQPGFEP